MSGVVFVTRPDVDQSDPTLPQQDAKLRQGHGLHAVRVRKVRRRDALHLGQSLATEFLQAAEKPGDLVAGQTVPDKRPLAPRLHQAGLAKDSQVGAGVLHRCRRLLGERLDRLVSLTQEVEEFEAFRACDGVPDASELGVDGVLEVTGGHGRALIF